MAPPGGSPAARRSRFRLFGRFLVTAPPGCSPAARRSRLRLAVLFFLVSLWLVVFGLFGVVLFAVELAQFFVGYFFTAPPSSRSHAPGGARRFASAGARRLARSGDRRARLAYEFCALMQRVGEGLDSARERGAGRRLAGIHQVTPHDIGKLPQ